MTKFKLKSVFSARPKLISTKRGVATKSSLSRPTWCSPLTVVRVVIALSIALFFLNLVSFSRVLQNTDENATRTEHNGGSGGYTRVQTVGLSSKRNNSSADTDKESNYRIGKKAAATHNRSIVDTDRERKKAATILGGEVKGGQLVKKDIRLITSDKDLGKLGDDDTVAAVDDLESARLGREKCLDILAEAGVVDLDVSNVWKLPTWDEVTKLYGDKPVIIGLDTCERFRNTVSPDEASIGVAGIFNTGTNPLFHYLNANCIMPKNVKDKYGGMRWQVPWGKHMLADRKWTNTAKRDEKVNKTAVLPVAIVRDPYTWMQSICRHPYGARFKHSKKHCPNLIPNNEDYSIPGFDVTQNTVKVRIDYPGNQSEWDSLAHLWSDWYYQYFKVTTYPRLIIRFEDLYFHASEIINTICECGGGELRNDNFTYVVDSTKWGKGHQAGQAEKTNLVSGMIKYGKEKHRYDSLTKEDLLFAHDAIDASLMSTFHYNIPIPP